MKKLKKLTEKQQKLIDLIREKRSESGIFQYDEMKNKCVDEIKSFDLTFNALLFKGHIKHFETEKNQNTFITTIK